MLKHLPPTCSNTGWMRLLCSTKQLWGGDKSTVLELDLVLLGLRGRNVLVLLPDEGALPGTPFLTDLETFSTCLIKRVPVLSFHTGLFCQKSLEGSARRTD